MVAVLAKFGLPTFGNTVALASQDSCGNIETRGTNKYW